MVKGQPLACGSCERLTDCKDSGKFILSIMEGLCSALDYIHKMGFVHRDLKLANVMVRKIYQPTSPCMARFKRKEFCGNCSLCF